MSFEKLFSRGIPLEDAASFFISMTKKAEWTDPPDMTGELEGRFMAPVEQVLHQMKSVISVKFRLMVAYYTYAQSFTDHAWRAIKTEFYEHAEDEQGGAEFYVKRATVLGGPVLMDDVAAPPPTTNPQSILQILARGEQEAIAAQRILRQMVGDENPMKVGIEEQLLKDQHHLDELFQMMQPEARLALEQASALGGAETLSEGVSEAVQGGPPSAAVDSSSGVPMTPDTKVAEAALRLELAKEAEVLSTLKAQAHAAGQGLKRARDVVATPMGPNYLGTPAKMVKVPATGGPGTGITMEDVLQRGRPANTAMLVKPQAKSHGVLNRTAELLTGTRLNQLQQGEKYWTQRASRAASPSGHSVLQGILDETVPVEALRGRADVHAAALGQAKKLTERAGTFANMADGEANRVALSRVGAGAAGVGGLVALDKLDEPTPKKSRKKTAEAEKVALGKAWEERSTAEKYFGTASEGIGQAIGATSGFIAGRAAQTPLMRAALRRAAQTAALPAVAGKPLTVPLAWLSGAAPWLGAGAGLGLGWLAGATVDHARGKPKTAAVKEEKSDDELKEVGRQRAVTNVASDAHREASRRGERFGHALGSLAGAVGGAALGRKAAPGPAGVLGGAAAGYLSGGRLGKEIGTESDIAKNATAGEVMDSEEGNHRIVGSTLGSIAGGVAGARRGADAARSRFGVGGRLLAIGAGGAGGAIAGGFSGGALGGSVGRTRGAWKHESDKFDGKKKTASASIGAAASADEGRARNALYYKHVLPNENAAQLTAALVASRQSKNSPAIGAALGGAGGLAAARAAGLGGPQAALAGLGGLAVGGLAGHAHRKHERGRSYQNALQDARAAYGMTSMQGPGVNSLVQAAPDLKVASALESMLKAANAFGGESGMAAPGAVELEPANYFRSEMVARRAQQLNEGNFYRELATKAQSEGAMAQQQMSDLQLQLQQSQELQAQHDAQLQQYVQQAAEAQQQATQAMIEAANSRMAADQFRAQIMQIASQGPPMAPAASPVATDQTGGALTQQEGMQPADPNAAATAQPTPPQQPSGPDVTAQSTAQTTAPEQKSPTTEVTKTETTKTSSLAERMVGGGLGALTGAGGSLVLGQQADSLRGQVEKVDPGQKGSFFAAARQAAQQARLAGADFAQKHPVGAALMAGAGGALSGALAGPSIASEGRRLVNNIKSL